MNRSIPVVLAACAAVLLAVVALPAVARAAEREDVPRDVAAYFHEEVARAVEATLAEARTIDEEMPLLPDGLEVGSIARVHDLRAGESKEPVVAREEWVAPLYRKGELVGTVAVWRDPAQKGALALAWFDTDVAGGKAVESLPAEARLVVDPPIGARFAFDGETLTSLVEVPGVLAAGDRFRVEDYGAYVQERAAAFADLSPEEGWSGGYDAPARARVGQIVQLLGALAFLVGLGLYVAQRRRTA